MLYSNAMFDDLWYTFMTWLAETTAALFTADFFWQIGLFLLVILLATLCTPWLKGRLEYLRRRVIAGAVGRLLPWLDGLLAIFQQTAWPLLAALAGSGAAAVLTEAGWRADLLQWLTLFLYLLFAYRLALAIIGRRFSDSRAYWLDARLLRPLVLSLATLHLLGIFARLLNVGFTISDSRVTIGGVLAGLFVFYLFAILSRESRSLLSESILPRTGIHPSLNQIVALMTAYTLLLVGFLLALGVVGIPLTAFAVIAGGLSVGIGFGLQELIGNFISGFILLLERSVVPGNVVQVGDTFGTVEQIGIRSTRIRNLDNVELIVPNSRFLNDEVVNFTRSDTRVRVRVEVGVSYDADPREVEQALLSAAEHPLLLADPPPRVGFLDFGDSSLDFVLLAWTEEAISRLGIASDLRYNIWYALKERDIEIPFPQRDIHVRSVTMPEKVSQLVD
jgi:potassium-dependent mechanosensitive channel